MLLLADITTNLIEFIGWGFRDVRFTVALIENIASSSYIYKAPSLSTYYGIIMKKEGALFS